MNISEDKPSLGVKEDWHKPCKQADRPPPGTIDWYAVNDTYQI